MMNLLFTRFCYFRDFENSGVDCPTAATAKLMELQELVSGTTTELLTTEVLNHSFAMPFYCN